MTGGRTLSVLSVLAVAGGAAAAAAPVAAAASGWRAPVTLAPRGVVDNGWIDSAGTFRAAGGPAADPRLVVVNAAGVVSGRGLSASAAGSVGLGRERTLVVAGHDPVHLTVLGPRGRLVARHVLRGRLPALLGFEIPAVVPLPAGGAVVCTDLAGGRGEELAVVSSAGAVRTTPVRRVGGMPASAAPTGGCYGASAAPRGPARAAVIYENADAAQGSGAHNAQLLVQRVRPGAAPAAPRPVLPAGERLTVNSGEPQVAETSAGWTLVTWLQSAPGARIRSWQNARWISPAGRLEPVRRLTPPSSGIPPAITLAAVGARAAVALINPEQADRVIASQMLHAPGGAGPRRRLYAGTRIAVPHLAGDGRRLVAAWVDARGVHAARWTAGRWRAPELIRSCEGSGRTAVCPTDPGVAMSARGRAAVWYSLAGPSPLGAGGEVVLSRPG